MYTYHTVFVAEFLTGSSVTIPAYTMYYMTGDRNLMHVHYFREDMSHLRFPRTIDSAKDLGRLLSKYKDTHYFTVLGSVVTSYILYPAILVSMREREREREKERAFIQ